MRSVPQAFTWQLWARPRGPAAALLAYLAVLALAARLPGAMEWRPTLFLCGVPLAFGVLFLLSAFAFPEGDVLGRGSGFPAPMLVLPVRTAQLAIWPVLWGGVTAALGWILPVWLFLRPLGAPAPLWWPAVMLAALLAWLQALLWAPFGLPYVRAAAALVGLPALVTLGVNAALAGVPEGPLAAAFGGLGLSAYGAVVAGLARARRGEVSDWLALPWVRARSGACRGSAAFGSARAAQRWFEWRSAGLALPLVVGAAGALASLPFLWVRDLVPLGMGGPPSALDGIQVNLWLKLQQASLFLPVLFGAVLGCGRRRADTRRGDLSLHPFLATRPLPETEFVRARQAAAAGSTAAAWAVMLLFAAGWLLLPAREGDRTAPLLLLLAPHCSRGTGLTLLAVLAALVFWTWKNQVQGLWADLSGRPWLVTGAPIVAHIAALAAFLWFVQGGSASPGARLRAGFLPEALPWLLGAALLLKAAAAGAAAAALRRRGLATPPELGRWVAAWAGAVAVILAIVLWLASTEAASGPLARLVLDTYLPVVGSAVPEAFRSPGTLAAVVVLFVPLARLLVAPAALAWNRHR